MSVALIFSGVAAAAYGAVFMVYVRGKQIGEQPQAGRAFSIEVALAFAAMLSGILVLSAALREWFGDTGIIVGAALAGLVDTHSAAISVATLVASGKMSASDAVIPILTGLSTNTISKAILAAATGGRSFSVRVVSWVNHRRAGGLGRRTEHSAPLIDYQGRSEKNAPPENVGAGRFQRTEVPSKRR